MDRVEERRAPARGQDDHRQSEPSEVPPIGRRDFAAPADRLRVLASRPPGTDSHGDTSAGAGTTHRPAATFGSAPGRAVCARTAWYVRLPNCTKSPAA